MPESNAKRCQDALGVLPLETVLAQEHDRIHGDDVVARLAAIPVLFTPAHVIAPGAFAHRLLRAWPRLRNAGARASVAVDATTLVTEDETPFDAVASFVLGTPSDDRRRAIYEALDECEVARAAAAARAGGLVATPGVAAPDVADAEARLVLAMVPHLNDLLERPIETEPAFATFIAEGAIDALGSREANTDQRLRRLLLEAAFKGQVAELRDLRLSEVYAATRQHDTAALCLSGGGIRSATFAIGVIRGLAHYGLLSKFDYLSTVSGGGYAGSWLSAWMHHTSATEVHEELRRPSREKLQPEPAPMQHLRAYSHFLTPRAGMFSTDTWTLATTILRNLLLNWMVLIPLMAAALLFPRFVVAILRLDYGEIPTFNISPRFGELIARPLLLIIFAVGLTFGTWAARFVHLNRPDDEPEADDAPSKRKRRADTGSQRHFVTNCFVPLVSAAMLLTTGLYLWWTWSREEPGLEALVPFGRRVLATNAQNLAIARDIQFNPITGTLDAHPGLVAMFLASGALMHVGGWLMSGRARRHPREIVSTLISGIAAGGAGLLMAVWFLSRADSPNREMLFATLAPPAFLGVMLIGSQLFTALTSFRSGDDEREWVTRFNAWLLIAIVMWAAVCALVLYGPIWVTGAWQQLTVGVVGGGSGLLGVLVAKSSSDRPELSDGVRGFLKKLALALAAPVFALSIIVALAALNENLIGSACKLPVGASAFDCRLREPLTDDYSKSKPFVVLARHQTEKVDSLSKLFGASGADQHLLDVFREGVRKASALRRDGDRRDESWQAMFHSVVDSAAAATATAVQADAQLLARIKAFTQAVKETDSLSLHGIGGDSLLKSFFLDQALAESRAETDLHDRGATRDSIAQLLDRSLLQIESLWGSSDVPGADTTPRPHLLGVLHDGIDARLQSSIHTFAAIVKDSIERHASRETVHERARVAGDVVPYDGAVPETVFILFLALLGLGLLLGAHIDTNKFSLRAMYEMRLVRAYLGASRPVCDRQPNPFTGFDPLDDVQMGALWPARAAQASQGGRSPSSPPMHVVNVTLNLVAGSNLAWQQRKAESMTITPLHAGSAFAGYRPTTLSTVPAGLGDKEPRLYGDKSGITLGTAVTISGAAASPNAGAMSSPMITFLMTFFNARLGAWLGNPGRAGSASFDRSAPSQKIQPILSEMFGLTSDKSPYVHLSDGGHFENLALYEMVLRRCRFIVVSDAGCDPNATFDDLGNAVRKIRVDLGVPIEFPDGVHIFSRGNTPADGSGRYWAVGRIKYSAVDGGDSSLSDGLLIYIKPSLYGREPSDVVQYSRTSETFPHEPTSDQFFSESQFESYRALGEFIVTQLVTDTHVSEHIDVKGSRVGSLLSNWKELLEASDVNVKIPASETGVWPTTIVEAITS